MSSQDGLMETFHDHAESYAALKKIMIMKKHCESNEMIIVFILVKLTRIQLAAALYCTVVHKYFSLTAPRRF